MGFEWNHLFSGQSSDAKSKEQGEQQDRNDGRIRIEIPLETSGATSEFTAQTAAPTPSDKPNLKVETGGLGNLSAPAVRKAPDELPIEPMGDDLDALAVDDFESFTSDSEVISAAAPVSEPKAQRSEPEAEDQPATEAAEPIAESDDELEWVPEPELAPLAEADEAHERADLDAPAAEAEHAPEPATLVAGPPPAQDQDVPEPITAQEEADVEAIADEDRVEYDGPAAEPEFDHQEEDRDSSPLEPAAELQAEAEIRVVHEEEQVADASDIEALVAELEARQAEKAHSEPEQQPDEREQAEAEFEGTEPEPAQAEAEQSEPEPAVADAEAQLPEPEVAQAQEEDLEPVAETHQPEPEAGQAEAEPIEAEQQPEPVEAQAEKEEPEQPAAEQEQQEEPVADSEQPDVAELAAAMEEKAAEEHRRSNKTAHLRLVENTDNTEDFRLAELLLAERAITREQLETARAEQSRSHNGLGSILVAMGAVSQEKILRAMAAQSGVSVWDADKEPPTPDALAQLKPDLCRKHRVIPVSLKGKLLALAMVNPQDMGAIDAIRSATGNRIDPLLSDQATIDREIERAHGVTVLQDSFEGLIKKVQKDFNLDRKGTKEKAVLTEADTRPVVGLVNHILTMGIRMSASDVHIEPRADRVDVRYRVDGELQAPQSVPTNLLPMLTTRLKIMADLDIVEFRVPQDGRMSVALDGRNVDVRVSVLPNYHGQRIVLRLLDRAAGVKELTQLGFTTKHLSLFRTMIRRPYGMLLVTGPTGSGKTTTLYAALKELQNASRNIMTCEDPVEYEIDGVSQSQVNEKVGLTFATQLRATLRQDPDVILVGEIRDKETAETAIRAALTGHLVLSTLHCNDAPGAVPRLLDMGVDPYLLSTCLIGVTAQRLLRTLCPRCAEQVQEGPDHDLIAAVLGEDQAPSVKRAKGCPECFGTGYRGRQAVHEIMPVTGEVASAIAQQDPISHLTSRAELYGYEPLQVNAMRRVIDGETSLAEAMRLIAFDQIRPTETPPLINELPKAA